MRRTKQALVLLVAAAALCGCDEPRALEPRPAPARKPALPAITNPDIPEAVRPIFAARCVSCHGTDGKGGPVAPNLFALSGRRTAAGWAEYLQNPQKFGKHMPAIQASDEEYRTLGAWLERIAGPR